MKLAALASAGRGVSRGGSQGLRAATGPDRMQPHANSKCCTLWVNSNYDARIVFITMSCASYPQWYPQLRSALKCGETAGRARVRLQHFDDNGAQFRRRASQIRQVEIALARTARPENRSIRPGG
jgi:hypothetical protein